MLSQEARVLRDEKWKAMDIKELTYGDIIELKTGFVIPADCRMI